MANIFDSIKLTKPNKNVFDLSHDVKLSFNMGELIPTMALECIPGDSFSIGCDSLLRFAPLVAPVMHRVDVYMHYFFVPNRLLWPNWEKFITNTPLTDGGTDVPAHPFVQVDEFQYTTLCDYMGIPRPETGAVTETINAFPFAAYNLIFNEYYRDQNLINPINYLLSDGDNDAIIPKNLLTRCWEHDYFTAALPWAQKGGTVEIPLAGMGDLPVYRNTPSITLGTDVTATAGPTPLHVDNVQSDNPAVGANELFADASTGTIDSTTINDLRRAYKLQEWLEKAARGGSRYVENILSFFGVKSPDARLNRPEYITGTKSPVVISEVLNTTGTAEQPQGDMAGHAVSVTQGKYGGYFCQEHGYIIGIMSVMPKTAYQQGIPRHFLKFETFDYYWPQFAHIGEQEIQNRELYAYTNIGGDTFGYIPRYAEYKYMANRVAGDFRTTLNFWHMGRIFETQPALNDDFVTSNPTTRIFAVTDEATQKMWCHILHKIRAVRPMPKFGTPTF